MLKALNGSGAGSPPFAPRPSQSQRGRWESPLSLSLCCHGTDVRNVIVTLSLEDGVWGCEGRMNPKGLSY